MTGCIVISCTNRTENRKEGVTFHRIPASPSRRKNWLIRIQRDPTDLYTHKSVICSEHFLPEDFVGSGRRRFIRPFSFPTQNLPPMVIPRQKKKIHFVHPNPPIPIQISESTEIAQTSSTTNVKAIDSDDDSVPLAFPLSPSTGSNSTSSTSTEQPIMDIEIIPSHEITLPYQQMGSSSSELSQRYSPTQVKGKRSCIESDTASPSSKSKKSSGSGTSVETRKRRKLVKLMHTYSHSPNYQMKKLTVLEQKCEKLKTELYNKKRMVTRLRKKVSSFKQIIHDLKRNDLVSSDAFSSLEQSISDVPSSIIRRFILNSRREKPSKKKYPPELRSFALTLHFYSAKAYDYVRNTFQLCLPAPSVIRSWYFNIDCDPGYCAPAFELIREKVSQSQQPVLCSLMLDEMAIKKKIEVVGSKTYGYIDMGTELDNDTLSEATNALVYMVVGINGNWKIPPIAYFLINSLTGREKANIVRESLVRLDEIGVKVISVTCDGPSSHFTMMSELGCDIKDHENIKPWFTHPSKKDEVVFFILDACHMLKLMRNCLHKLQVIKNPNGEEICWKYFKYLFEIQESEQLNLGCKLGKQHMEWQRQKMKVKLAAQTLSRSTADAMEYLMKDEKRKEFEGAGPTIEFIRIVDGLFDLLNSRNPFAKGTKSALRCQGEPFFRPFLENAKNFLLKCTDVAGRNLLTTNRKTPFLGFATTITSVLGLYDKYVKPGTPLKYLLTYKLSQDHLELYFCWVRSRNGFNNNPTAFQFISIFKRLLLHHDIKKVTGNCVPIDTTSILNISSQAQKKNITENVNISDINVLRKYNMDYSMIEEMDIPNIEYNPSLSEYIKNVVNYIAGFVVSMVQKKLHCVTCLDALVCQQETMDDTHMALFNRKNKGGLIKATPSVRRICHIWEIYIRNMMQATDNKIPPEKNYQPLLENIISNILLIKPEIFPSLSDHFYETSLDEESHKKILLKLVGLSYCRIRMFHLAKRHNEKISGPKCRQLFNKLVLFKHQ